MREALPASPAPERAPHPAREASGVGQAAVVLGFDFGTRRIGVAIGNRVTKGARPLRVIEAEGQRRWRAVEAVVAEWQPAQLVVGVARDPDGAPHEMTRRCERFARQLEGRFRLPVARVDERYSSVVLEPAHSTDDRAAAVILQQWLDELADGRAEAAGAAEGAGA
jgi:putative Holliday junction resolvase